MTIRPLGLLLLSLLLVRGGPGLAASPTGNVPQVALQRFEFLQIRMAIAVRITVYAPDEPAANHAVQAAYSRIKQIDRLLSHYDPDSELSVLCRDALPGKPIQVSDELFLVLSQAARLWQQTDGTFDVTVGPLMDLWRRSRRAKSLPEGAELKSARDRTGFQHVQLDATSQSVTLNRSGMKLDLGGIAKGYAADEALHVLREHGIDRVLIDAGGDIVAGQAPPGEDGWRIGVAPLDDPQGTPDRYLLLRDAAVATSGDAAQYVEIDGTRYSHIMDPRTGLGLTTRSSVTIVAADGMTADALASAVSVLGPERGLEVLHTIPEAEGLIVIGDGTGTRSRESTGFRKHLLVDGPSAGR